MKYEITRGPNGCTLVIELCHGRELTIVRKRMRSEYEGEDTIEVGVTKPEFSSTINPYELIEEVFKALVDALDKADIQLELFQYTSGDPEHDR